MFFDDPGVAFTNIRRALCPAGRLREALAAHLAEDGVWFDSRAWIITARRHRTENTTALS